MSTQDDDELKLEPPQAAQPPRAQPPAERTPDPPPAAVDPAQPPAGRPAGPELEPGRGKPLVEGPPMSVDEPVSDSTINRTAAFAGIGLVGIGLIVAVIVILLVVLAVCTHR
jgi:hypothetical protein